MILLDANLFLYTAGAPHRFKVPATRFLRRVAAGEIDAAIDAEILQEILHRYRALRRWKEGRELFDLALSTVPVVLSVDERVMRGARALMDEHSFLEARDALHAAVCAVHGAEAIASFDRDFDRLPELKRIEPS